MQSYIVRNCDRFLKEASTLLSDLPESLTSRVHVGHQLPTLRPGEEAVGSALASPSLRHAGIDMWVDQEIDSLSFFRLKTPFFQPVASTSTTTIRRSPATRGLTPSSTATVMTDQFSNLIRMFE